MPEDYTLEKLLERIASFTQMERGWYKGEGEVLSQRLAERIKDFLTLLFQEKAVTLPSSFPTIPGGVQLEWREAPHSVELTFEPDGTIHCNSYHIHSHLEEDFKVSGITPENVLVIAHWLRGYF